MRDETMEEATALKLKIILLTKQLRAAEEKCRIGATRDGDLQRSIDSSSSTSSDTETQPLPDMHITRRLSTDVTSFLRLNSQVL